MHMGYPCRNLSLPTKAIQTFRLKPYSDGRLVEVISENQDMFDVMLEIKDNETSALEVLKVLQEVWRS